jgi:hypothetical protein
MPDRRVMEFDKDASVTFLDLVQSSPRSPGDSLFAYNDDNIDKISSALGIPWETSKTIPFDTKVPYLGFVWDLQARTMAIPPGKKDKYLKALRQWASCKTHALNEVQKLYGKLLHVTLVVTAGCAYLMNLESMLGSFNNSPYTTHHAPKNTEDDIRWWSATLRTPDLFRTIPGPHPVIDKQAFSDASSGFGVAITIGDRWCAWRLLPG